MWGSALVLLSLSVAPSLTAMDAVDGYNRASSRPLPPLHAAEVTALSTGEAVTRLIPPEKPGGAYGVVGLLVADVPKEELWITIRDGHLAVADGLTERHISGHYNERDQVWFGMLKLPPPFKARHWRIHTRTEIAQARKTDGRAWESTWERIPDGAALNRADAASGRLRGITPDAIDNAIYTAENHGSWLVVGLDKGRSLLIYRATVDLGGVIPSAAVGTFARLRLESLLKETVAQVPLVRTHYVGKHELILGGHGRPLPVYPRPPSSE